MIDLKKSRLFLTEIVVGRSMQSSLTEEAERG